MVSSPADESSFKTTPLFRFMFAICAIAFAGVIAFLLFGDNIEDAIGNTKVFETSYMFLLITVIGGGVTYLYRGLERDRDERERGLERDRDKRERELERLSTLREIWSKDLQNAYNSAKSVRRQLRADLGTIHSVGDGAKIQAAEYGEKMDTLADAQLTFESYAKLAKTPGLGLFDSDELSTALSKIEKYLNKIVKEYQEELSNFAGDPPEMELRDLKRLIEFIGPSAQAKGFKRKFKKRFQIVLRELGNALVRGSRPPAMSAGLSSLQMSKRIPG